MKTLYITPNASAAIDTELNDVFSLPSDREAISRIHLIKEAMHVVIGNGENKKEFDVEPGDILIKFYDDIFPNKAIVVKSAEWKENIEYYDSEMQRQRDEWAKNKSSKCPCCGDCGCCKCEDSCAPEAPSSN